ncbi:MAG: hypothetical protein ACI4TK_04390 [Agathobacter sp.]
MRTKSVLMKKTGLLICLCLICSVMGCGKPSSETGAENRTSENEGGSLLGLITEVTEESYKVKFMGYYVNEIEMYIMVDRKLGEFAVGDDVMVGFDGKVSLTDGAGNKVNLRTTGDLGEFITGKTEVIFEGEVTSLTACENDGVFEGTVTGFDDLLNADMEPIGLSFCIKPLEGEPEAGRFSFSNLDLGYGFDLNDRVEVTYNPETLEIISVTEK